MDRRTFLQSLSIAPLVKGLDVGSLTVSRPAFAEGRKAVLISMLPADVPYARRFALAREAGFDAVEMQTIARSEEAAEIREGASRAGIRIHSVMNADHWRFPLSSRDPETVTRSVAGMETSLQNAALSAGGFRPVTI